MRVETLHGNVQNITTDCHVCGRPSGSADNSATLQNARSRLPFSRPYMYGDNITLPSCILCVQKHVSRAMEYYDELLTARGSGTADGTASVDTYKDYIKLLGHMGAAIEESEEFTELNELLIDSERGIRYYGKSPDWSAILEKMVKYGGKVPKIT